MSPLPAKARTVILPFDVHQDDKHQLADLRSAQESALAVILVFVVSFLNYSDLRKIRDIARMSVSACFPLSHL